MTNNLTTFYIVRHGQSIGNKNFEEGKTTAYSKLGSELSELGVEQALKLQKVFSDIAFDLVYSSHLLRARQTAEIITANKKIAVLTTEVLKERSKGETHKGKTESELRETFKDLFAAFETLSDEDKFTWKLTDDWESWEEVTTRFSIFLRELAVANPSKTILIVTHSNVMRSFLVKIGYGSIAELPSGSVSNTGYLVVESDGIEFFLKETSGIQKKGAASSEE